MSTNNLDPNNLFRFAGPYPALHKHPPEPKPVIFRWDASQEPLWFLREMWSVLTEFRKDQEDQIEQRLRRFTELYGMDILLDLEIVYDPP